MSCGKKTVVLFHDDAKLHVANGYNPLNNGRIARCDQRSGGCRRSSNHLRSGNAWETCRTVVGTRVSEPLLAARL